MNKLPIYIVVVLTRDCSDPTKKERAPLVEEGLELWANLVNQAPPTFKPDGEFSMNSQTPKLRLNLFLASFATLMKLFPRVIEFIKIGEKSFCPAVFNILSGYFFKYRALFLAVSRCSPSNLRKMYKQ